MMTAIYLVTQHVRLRGGEGGEEGGGVAYCSLRNTVLF